MESISHCIGVLKRATTDTERFAALMLVAKIVKAPDLGSDEVTALFDAVGVSFLRRLLRTGTVPEGCPENVYKSLAVTVLSCFSAYPTIAGQPQVLNLLPDLNQLLLSNPAVTDSNEADVQIVNDCYDILNAMVVIPDGQQAMINHHTVRCLCQIVAQHMTGREKALSVLQHLASTRGPACWASDKNQEGCHMLLQQLVKEFCEQQDAEKFRSCDILAQVMSSLDKREPHTQDHPWKDKVREALMLILRSKLGQPQRDPAIVLASQMVRVYGVPWALSTSTPGDPLFLLLLVQLVCIEVRLAMESADFGEVEQKYKLLCACFSVLEEVISHMISEVSMELTSKQVSQLHSAMVGAFNGVIYFLDQISKQSPDKATSAIVCACVRVLGSWMAEETTALAKDIYNILPFLLEVCKKTSKDPTDDTSTDGKQSDKGGSIEVLPFLLPALCHLTAEDQPRQIILENDNLNLLVTFFFTRWSQLVQKVDHQTEVQLNTLCGVLLNLVVTEEARATEHPLFHLLHKMVMSALPVIAYSTGCVQLAFNLTALGIMLSRHQSTRMAQYKDICEKFFIAAVHVLKRGHQVHGEEPNLIIGVSSHYAELWDCIAELWALSMQALTALLPSVDWLSGIIWESGWITNTLHMFRQTEGRELSGDMSQIYQQFLVAVASHHPAAATSITKDEEILRLARKLKWTELQRLIQK